MFFESRPLYTQSDSTMIPQWSWSDTEALEYTERDPKVDPEWPQSDTKGSPKAPSYAKYGPKVAPKSPSHAKNNHKVILKYPQSRPRLPKVGPKLPQIDPQSSPTLKKSIPRSIEASKPRGASAGIAKRNQLNLMPKDPFEKFWEAMWLGICRFIHWPA